MLCLVDERLWLAGDFWLSLRAEDCEPTAPDSVAGFRDVSDHTNTGSFYNYVFYNYFLIK